MAFRSKDEIREEISRLESIRYQLADRINAERWRIYMKQTEIMNIQNELSRLGGLAPMAMFGEVIGKAVGLKGRGPATLLARMEQLRKEIDREMEYLQKLTRDYTIISDRIFRLTQELNRMILLEQQQAMMTREEEIQRLLEALRRARAAGQEHIVAAIIRRLRELGYTV